ncbi:NeuD/PglB/VioB family sugar acetyltransferase [Rhizobium mesoamericanum]|uniref:Transferase hexapeptide repeat containing protein n=1 Tax=Rhizobium mesoamericanum STM3625 TaxID=1211777 RepID=K0PS58_9HYPH|nr:NeuD/PglB/VioB family sugar acetyltransferase [Rhizobium mesoamericanum]CCM79576.1 Transferase hexapeptide repeat containing protein [Rhizobium mesoamericanum STM3625]
MARINDTARTSVPRGLYILGFGGHARSVADVAVSAGWNAIIFIDGNAREGEHFSSYRTISEFPDHPEPDWQLFPAAGDNSRRRAQIERSSATWATLISPSAQLGIEADVGEATLVGHGAHIGPGAVVGKGVILNTQSIIEHEAVIGDYTHVSVNTVVAGRSRIGRNVFVGAGAVVIDSISVCDDVVIGAGAVVTTSISEPGVYVGTPARRVK